MCRWKRRPKPGRHALRTIRRVMVPLMAGGILAGFVTSFITAAVELSATILLASAESQAPMSYGIYLYMQSMAGRGPGAALGVLAMVVVAVGTYLSHRFVERSRATVLHAVSKTSHAPNKVSLEAAATSA
jgi:iron(III) transport system permease protein